MNDIQALRAANRALLAKRTTLQDERDELVARRLELTSDDAGLDERIQRLERGIERTKEQIEENANRDVELMRASIDDGRVWLTAGSDVGRDEDPYRFNVNRGRNPFEAGPVTDRDDAHEVRSRATTAVEDFWRADDAIKEAALATIARAGANTTSAESIRDIRGVAAHLLRYSDPLYIAAFRKYARDPETYIADLTSDEARAWRAAREEQRTTLAVSGAVLPSPLDPTIVISNDGADSPMRRVARVDTTVANEKRYITSAGSTFSFDAEAAEVSDDTHAETEVTITTRKAQGFITATLEVALDQPDFSVEATKIIADAKDRLEGDTFIRGAAGSNQPIGIETALAGGSSEVDAAGEALVADDVYGTLEALPARWRPNATWQLELSTRNFIHRLFNPSGSEPPLIMDDTLCGVPYVLNSDLDPYSDVDATATATNRVAIVGDWQQYVILDRIGLAVHYIPPGVLQNTANGRPDGRVGWYAYWRVGADSLVDGAFRMLDVQTTA